MTAEEQTLIFVRGTISSLSDDDQAQVNAIAATLRNIVKDGAAAQIAFALVGAELAIQS